MEIGPFTIEQLGEGQFHIYEDGQLKRVPSGNTGREEHPEVGKAPLKVGINPILVSRGEEQILLDTGLGWGLDAGSRYRDVSNIKTNLDIFELSTGDITCVILTHLHYDHAAGASYNDAESRTRATFPNATYYVQQREWEYALDQVHSEASTRDLGYQLDEFYRLRAEGRLEFLDGDVHNLVPGLSVMHTGGHTPGHQAVKLHGESESAYYLGDLLSDEDHLNQYITHDFDVYPNQAKKMKIRLMREVFEENGLLLFYHSLFSSVGRLGKNKEKEYVLKKV